MTTSVVLNQIGIVNKCLNGLKVNATQDDGFLELVEQRRKLKQIAEAQKEKPAIAAFGESQKGKSYLISSLLQKKRSPFMVKNELDGDLDFFTSVSPLAGWKEATGVVTRFTSFNAENEIPRYSKTHPVIVKLFNVADLATILCDSYHQDLLDSQFYSDDELRAITEDILSKYSSLSEQPQGILTEDDILDVKDYLAKYVKVAQGILRSGYFERLALVIHRVPQSEWVDVLEILWHRNPAITTLFRRLLDALKTLKFSREVYVDFDAVMHLGDNKNTIMSVDCLNGLDDAAWKLKTRVYLSGTSSEGIEFLKCELCALCAETIFKIEPEYLTDEEEYFYNQELAANPGYLTSRSYSHTARSVKKDLLSQTDLLDFPGACNYLKVPEKFLVEKESEGLLLQILFRPKVRFLFNSYNEKRIINILLFCHDSEQSNVPDMYRMINDWVEKYVGKDSQTRRQTVQSCGGISPLFVVGTKFNTDMIEKHEIDGDSDDALNLRWNRRFMKVLYTQSFNAENIDWFNNWDAPGETFKNTYLMRDFKYSGCDGVGNNLYRGYNKNDASPRENELVLSATFYERLKDTFVTNPNVAKFFADPEVSWDVAATINNDGSLYIIEKLAIVANHMNVVREDQFAAECKKINADVRNIMKKYYVMDEIHQ